MKIIKISVTIFLGFSLAILLAGEPGQKAEIRMIDGVKHVINSETPLHGVIVLEAEKVLEVDPYSRPEFGLKFFHQARGANGNFILYGDGEAHRFSKEGRYEGPLFRKGQGPGEFASSISIYFMDGEIWVSDYGKLARLDGSGKLLAEKKLDRWAEYFIDDSLFFETKPSPNGRSVELVRFHGPGDPKNESRTFLKMNKPPMHRDPSSNRGFAAVWVTPDIRYSVDPKNGQFFGMFNDDYRIEVKDLHGILRCVIEKPFHRIKLSRADKEKMLFIRGEADQWKMKICPDEMVVVYDFHVLPKGFLGVQRFIGPADSELDVFDSEGRFIYIVRHPVGIPFDRMEFHSSGFSTILFKDDGFVYADFKIKNLSTIFE